MYLHNTINFIRHFFLQLTDDAYLENFGVVVTPANNESVDNCGNNTMSWSRIIFKVSYY